MEPLYEKKEAETDRPKKTRTKNISRQESGEGGAPNE
jgi:hypothetical protein